MEIITLEEEQIRPAGKSRDEPNMNPFLEEPKSVPYHVTVIWLSHVITSHLLHTFLCS